MKTTIAYDELNGEFQELYLACKQWLSDLDFLDREYVFLKKLLAAADLPAAHQDILDRIPDVQILALETAQRQVALKADVLRYLLLLETYITDSSQPLSLQVIDTHAKLKVQLAELKITFGSVRTQIFTLVKK